MNCLQDIVAENIRRRRKGKGLSQERLSEELGTGCNQSAVSRWELGASFPDAHNLCALADVFGCTVDELLGRGK